jgi:hypothetical protein
VIVAEVVVSEAWRSRIAEWLVGHGCLYAVAWGVECSEWHDSVDWANLEAFNFKEVPDESHVMTTWHDDEPLSEAFWFAGHCAFHSHIDLEETRIVHVSAESREAEILQTFHHSQTIADGPD